MLAVGIALLASPASAGSLFQGCDESAGTIFMDGDTGDIDHFVAGYKPSTKTVRVEGTRQNSSGTIMSVITCQSSSWKQFSSKLRDRPDRVRTDAVGMSVAGYGPLPNTMKTVLNGGNGNDRLTGHGGPDDINGAGGEDVLNGLAGDDVIRTADGEPDGVSCGPGQDKVKADSIDNLLDCENVVISRPAP
jgi:Ca2+-binding RTX toxin-like protein